MTLKFNFSAAAIVAAACVLGADAQTTRHFVPNRGRYPDNNMTSGLGGGSVGLQKGVSVQPAATPKTINV